MRGRKILEIFVKSLISFLMKATSALFNKKSELKNDFSDKNKSNFDKLITLFFIKTLGFCNFTTRFNSLGLIYILVFLNSNFIYKLLHSLYL